jgi:flagellin
MIQTAEGALKEVQSMMQRMRDLAVQAASDTNSQTERQDINLELHQLQLEIDSISTRTKFNGQALLKGDLAARQATTAWDTAAFELFAGTGLNAETTATTSVVGINVGGSSASVGYNISSDTAANTVVLTQVDTAGAATGLSEAVAVGLMVAGDTQTLDFSSFGVKITLASGNGAAIADIVTSFDATNGYAIDVQTGAGAAILQTGSNMGDTTTVSFVDTRLAGTDASMVDLNTKLNAFSASVAGNNTADSQDKAGQLIDSLDTALTTISMSRAVLGAAQNRLQHTIGSLSTTSQNLSAANSRIVDVDVATESSVMAKSQVLEQAGVSVLAQANQLPQLALKLLG